MPTMQIDNLSPQRNQHQMNVELYANDVTEWMRQLRNNNIPAGSTPENVYDWLQTHINYLIQSHRYLTELAKPDELDLDPVMDTIKQWPEVVRVEHNEQNNSLIVSFCPVLIDGFPTGLQHIELLSDGRLRGARNTVHPHAGPGGICLGDAGNAIYATWAQKDVVALFTVIRQWRLGFSQLDLYDQGWRSQARGWWQDIYQSGVTYENDQPWDGRTVQRDNDGAVGNVEELSGHALEELLDIMTDREREDDDAREEASGYSCARCGTHVSEDEVWVCQSCDDAFCSRTHYHSHAAEDHERFPCAWCDDDVLYRERELAYCTYCCEHFCLDSDCINDHCNEFHDGSRETIENAPDRPQQQPTPTPTPPAPSCVYCHDAGWYSEHLTCTGAHRDAIRRCNYCTRYPSVLHAVEAAVNADRTRRIQLETCALDPYTQHWFIVPQEQEVTPTA